MIKEVLKNNMRTIGVLLICGVLIWGLVVTFPFLWWLWVIIAGGFMYFFGGEVPKTDEDIRLKEVAEKQEKEKKAWDEKAKNFK